MITQLDPPLPLDTPKGRGWAHLLIDCSEEHDLLWVVFLNEDGECWTFSNAEIRMVSNISLGRYGSNPLAYSRFGSGDPVGKSHTVLDSWGDGPTSTETAGS